MRTAPPASQTTARYSSTAATTGNEPRVVSVSAEALPSWIQTTTGRAGSQWAAVGPEVDRCGASSAASSYMT